MSDYDEKKIIADYFNNENKNMGFGFYDNEMYNKPTNIFSQPQVADDVETDLSYLDDRAEENLRFAHFAQQAYRPLDERTNIDDYEYMPDVSNKFIAHFKNDDRKELVHAITGSKFRSDILTDVTLAIPPFASLVDKISKFNPFGDPNDFGLYGDLTKRENQINEVKKKYPNYKNIYSGHSLGGMHSTEFAKKDPKSRAFTFNPAILGRDDMERAIGIDVPSLPSDVRKKYPNIYNYRIIGDIVSGAGALDGKVYNLKILEPTPDETKHFKKIFEPYPALARIPEAVYMPHRLDNFLDRTKQKISEDYKKYPRQLTQDIVGGSAFTSMTPFKKLHHWTIFGTGMIANEFMEFARQLIRRPTHRQQEFTRHAHRAIRNMYDTMRDVSGGMSVTLEEDFRRLGVGRTFSNLDADVLFSGEPGVRKQAMSLMDEYDETAGNLRRDTIVGPVTAGAVGGGGGYLYDVGSTLSDWLYGTKIEDF